MRNPKRRKGSRRTRRTRTLRFVRSTLCALWFGGAVAGGTAAAQALDGPLTVEKVDVQGNQFLQKDTLLFYVSTKPGDTFDEWRVKEDFRRLWDTGFLDDMRVDVLDGAQGKVVVFTIKERKRVQIVDYRGTKALSTTNIEDELKKKEASLRIDSFYDPAKARRVEAIIAQMLADKGHPFAKVKHDAKSLGGAGVQVSFLIEEGARAKVKEVEFTGNEVFSDGALRARMKKIKVGDSGDVKGIVTAPLRWGKNTFTEEKWADPQEGDKKRLQDFYLNQGYVTATVGEPRITYIDGRSGFFKKKPVKWARLEIPVTEGQRYQVGEVKFDGLTVFKEQYIRPLLKVETGEWYRESRVQKFVDKMRDAYGAQGYFQWTVGIDRKPNAETGKVDVTLRMDEDKRYFVGRIKFTGNDTTRDKVIRREVYLNEGDVFNTEALKLSIRRINQLGYFKPMEQPPAIEPSRQGEDKLDLVFKVEEQNRNQFTFGGGVSGLEGTFINASFSTANFLGLGETFQISAQSGSRTKNYQIAITEPYLFDRPITAGIDLFSRKITYDNIDNVVGYSQKGTGGSLTVGLPVGRFSRVYANYAYEVVDIQGLANLLDPDPFDDEVPVLDPFLFGQEGKRRESRLTPSFIYNTVDNPYTPHSGMKFTAGTQFIGGPLGGTLDLYKPSLEAILYIPHTKRTSLGLRVEGSYVRPFGDTTLLPYYQRFFLGGETQIRGYDIRTVGPVDATGRTALGGNKYALFNAEYYFDIGGPLRFVLFFDAGQAFLEGQNIEIKKLRTSTGGEMRFIMPVLNVPFRLIYAFNPHRDSFQPKSTFKFAVGTTF
jgi:outer membrane protein insertion porin family